MAIDTREKRASVLGVGRPWMNTKEPGAVDQLWRHASGMSYAGTVLSPGTGRSVVRLVGDGGLVSQAGLTNVGGGLIG